uniref:Uncharacterized protein n=1 Tax=Streptomyces sp. NBC_00049 TaxID=2903617 RepID=A0AAU2JYQ7_9ACTN
MDSENSEIKWIWTFYERTPDGARVARFVIDEREYKSSAEMRVVVSEAVSELNKRRIVGENEERPVTARDRVSNLPRWPEYRSLLEQ